MTVVKRRIFELICKLTLFIWIVCILPVVILHPDRFDWIKFIITIGVSILTSLVCISITYLVFLLFFNTKSKGN